MHTDPSSTPDTGIVETSENLSIEGTNTPDELQAPENESSNESQFALTEGEKAVEKWTDVEIVTFYDAHLAGKKVGELSAKELQIAVRYGNIAKDRREMAEQTGFQAEAEAVRRQVAIQVNRYATAALLEEYHTRSFNELVRGGEPDEVRLVVRYRRREIELGPTHVALAFGSFTNAKMRDFMKALDAVLSLAKSTATQHRNRIERQKGRDWAQFTKDIRWSAIVNEMRDEDLGNLD